MNPKLKAVLYAILDLAVLTCIFWLASLEFGSWQWWAFIGLTVIHAVAHFSRGMDRGILMMERIHGWKS
jgi:hypothetical protein